MRGSRTRVVVHRPGSNGSRDRKGRVMRDITDKQSIGLADHQEEKRGSQER